ncbi:MAG TPA: MMPL family transporter, partial [Alphaproteobacteria bacterium]|nr:MMPL family transporter [Alphaproteobacteria bacterium]
MLANLIVKIVDLSRRCRWLVILAALAASVGFGYFDAHNFKINTDINKMMAADLPWRVREADLEKAFPNRNDVTLIVVESDVPDAAESGAAALAEKLAARTDMFTLVTRPDSIPFFRKNGLLFLSKDELSKTLNQMVEAQPMLGALTADPSLRGFFGTIDLMLQGLQHNAVTFDKLDKPFNVVSETIEAALAGQDKPIAWQSMTTDAAPTMRDLRKFILVKPVLDYSALEPGQASNEIIRKAVNDLHLPDQGVRVRLTGDVPLNDEEFASVANGTGFATILSGVLVFVILMIALRSLRIVLPILLTLTVGLIATTAFALFAVGSLNLISVAFAVMFIGIAVDFGIQFGVRYRDQHHQEPDHAKAMTRTAAIIAMPLAMAAGSTSLGFLAFIPTAYTGVSELGLIAGAGMLIAFILNITLLPALLSITKPPAEPEAIGYSCCAPIDNCLLKYRKVILALALIIGLVGAGIATHLRFDFDPLNLKDTHTESVSTLLDLMKDPDFGAYTVQILRPNLKDTQDVSDQLEKLPEVDHAMSLASFVPEDQDAKLAMISDTNMLLGPTLTATNVQPAPSDEDVLASLKTTVDALAPIASQYPSADRLMKALAEVISRRDHDLL